MPVGFPIRYIQTKQSSRIADNWVFTFTFFFLSFPNMKKEGSACDCQCEIQELMVRVTVE
jgi:hypothetical protein